MHSNFPFLYRVIGTVSHIKILGCIFSNDMKWNTFVDSLIKRASQRVYLILNLKRADCPPELLFRAYCTYIRSILLYTFPAFCNMPSYLKEKMLRVEKRIFRIIDNEDLCRTTLFSAGNQMCVNLFEKVCQEPLHPLRSFFDTRTRYLRADCALRKPKSKTKRFSDSFIRFCP